MLTRNVSVVWAIVGLMTLAAPLGAGEPRAGAEVVAKVDDVVITRDDVALARRFLTIANPELTFNNRQIIEHLIDRVLWQRYIAKQGLRPSAAVLQRAIQAVDDKLRQQGSTYQKSLAALGLTAEEDAANLSFELAMERLGKAILAELRQEEIKAEFDARPEWYDGSRVRISEICLDTRDFAHDPDRLRKAKERIGKIHEMLQGGDFDRLARDYSDGRAGVAGGDLGWFLRNGKPLEEHVVAPTWPFESPMRMPCVLRSLREPVAMEAGPMNERFGLGAPRPARAEPMDEALIAAAWGLKVGEFTKPIQSARGWHILKVTEREPAYSTFQGTRAAVRNALARRRIEAILKELRAKAKIETFLQVP
ncbi:MAG: hypothetical protein FJ290_29460 [Planctomycetes bacterium]|nr:hypothetical protein [Planctomycetota bacterium]